MLTEWQALRSGGRWEKWLCSTVTLQVHLGGPDNSCGYAHVHTCRSTHVLTSISLLKNLTC